MNEVFNPRRFRLLFVKTILERPMQLLGSFALSFSVVILIYFLFKIGGNFEAAQLFSFTVGFIGGGCFLASMVFGYFSDGANSASYLTLPASGFEKWLCGVLIVGVIYVVCFLLFFRGLDTLFVHFFHKGLNPLDPRYNDQYRSVYIFSFPEAKILFIFFMNAVGAMLVGSLYFNKIPFIKVALIICGMYFFTFLLAYMTNSILFKNAGNSYPFHNVIIKNGDEIGVVTMPEGLNQAYDIIVLYILPAILLITSYIRLKEKEA